MTPIQWINDSFIVIDAWQNLGFAQRILDKFRGRWIVIFRRHEEGTKWYLLTRSEFEAKVKGNTSEIRVERALGLREHLASEAFSGRRAPPQSLRVVKALALNSPNRVVFVQAKTGVVRAIGTLQPAGSAKAGAPLKQVGRPSIKKAPVRKAAKKTAARRAMPRNAVGRDISAQKARAAGITFAEPTSQPIPSEGNHPYTLVPVYFGTDREPEGTGGIVTFGKNRDPEEKIRLGCCHVSIPIDHHTMGELESPKWYRLEFKRDPAKHVLLWDTTVLEPDSFYRDLRAQVRSSADKAAFVFIHGFNVSFENAVRRTGQMAYDLNFGGAAVLFSWPSRASVKGYFADSATIASSAKHFQDFLDAVIRRSGAEVLHVIAHSMGNRALLSALQRLAGRKQESNIHNVILAAPDEDRMVFTQVAKDIQKLPKRVTLYASSNDKALLASKAINGSPRAGESGKNLIILPFLDTVDASAVDTDFLGHSYAMGDRFVLSDVFELLKRCTGPDGRAGLRKVVAGALAGPHWAFRR
ncbi:esterase/lipase superfamily enzyme [Granulicella aggregans]|uniref:Esterase/lipase superfamily enzyme n=1 Tax=Granulicella aggregans TaxID=474949 RepID=A0A7W7ZAQ9_9BACT|nr:alpha/beta hydrolase [Granulicella aggregans]MBB5056423.1 esterase/lipase superfamily enzyme [Granulicella aggregans]